MPDLADLISMAAAQTPGVAQGAQAIGYRQGLIVEYDPQTGENTVELAGVLLQNLPTLVQGYGTVLRVGMPVGVLVVGSQMVILGRLAIPDGINNVNVPFVTYAQSQATNFVVGTSAATVVSVEFQVPDWANSVNFGMGSSGFVFNSAATVRRILFQITVNGNPVAGENLFTAQASDYGPLVYAQPYAMNVTPGDVLTLAVRLRANSAMAADLANNAYLSAAAFWAPSKLV